MADSTRHPGRMLQMCGQGVSIALMLAKIGVLGLVTIQSVKAQTFTLLHTFAGPLKDGATPSAGLVMDAKGNLYGTTTSGGSSGYYGTVFKVSATGKETVLHSFTNGPTDGAYPEGGLVVDADGNLYGTTTSGGNSGGQGTVFKVDKNGDESLLYSFSGGADGASPNGTLILDGKGNLYGTTFAGGDMQCGNGCGVVFKLNKAGHETVLHTCSGPDGAVPNYTILLMDAKGNLYGNTLAGGTSNMGVVYKLTRSGKLTVLHSFAGGEKDGCYPWGGLVSDATGNLYGTTQVCGAFDGGTVYKLSTSGKLTLLHNFAGFGGSRGGSIAGVIRDADGNLYGDTTEGGSTRSVATDAVSCTS
jgi:uncharacterized repeat protein (TIGR03803 family)